MGVPVFLMALRKNVRPVSMTDARSSYTAVTASLVSEINCVYLCVCVLRKAVFLECVEHNLGALLNFGLDLD